MLSKSRLIHHRQCPKRLWLRQTHPDFSQASPGVEAIMANGNLLGEIARELQPGGVIIDGTNLTQAIKDTANTLKGRKCVLYEATFAHKDVLVRADLLLPVRGGYDMVEVKSTTKVKPYHIEDAAIQAWVIRNAGLPIKRVKIAHLNSGFVYSGKAQQRVYFAGGEQLDCPGTGVYRGLLVHVDITDQVEALWSEVPKWVRAAHKTLNGDEPAVEPGEQCTLPFDCPFKSYCRPPVKGYPVDILKDKNLVAELRAQGYTDLRKVPKKQLTTDKDRRIWQATKTGIAVLDHKAGEQLAKLPYPRYYLDFETIQFVVPIWPGTGPGKQLPFQWSCHMENRNGVLKHAEFLAEDGKDPRRAFAESLIRALRARGPVFIYNRGFESARLRELVVVFPDLAPALEAIVDRMVDLLPITRENYYHRDMRGCWSIKDVLPTIAPELAYDNLDVANGGMASLAFAKLIDPATSDGERKSLRRSLLEYCARDTLAMVRLANHFQGR